MPPVDGSLDKIYDPSLLRSQTAASYQPRWIHDKFPEAIELYEQLETIAWHPDGMPDRSWGELLTKSPLPQIQAKLARSRVEYMKTQLKPLDSHST